MQSCTFVRFKFDNGGWNAESTVKPDPNHTVETFQVADFVKVESSIPADLIYRVTDGAASISVSAPENYHDYIKCEVNDGRLYISVVEGKKLSPRQNIKLELASSTLNGITINGAADVLVPDGLDTDSFSLLIRGAADATVRDLKCADAKVTIQGAGNVDVSGLDAHCIECLIQGAGDINLSGMAETAKITVQGAGDIDIDDLFVQNLETNVKGLSSKR